MSHTCTLAHCTCVCLRIVCVCLYIAHECACALHMSVLVCCVLHMRSSTLHMCVCSIGAYAWERWLGPRAELRGLKERQVWGELRRANRKRGVHTWMWPAGTCVSNAGL